MGPASRSRGWPGKGQSPIERGRQPLPCRIAGLGRIRLVVHPGFTNAPRHAPSSQFIATLPACGSGCDSHRRDVSGSPGRCAAASGRTAFRTAMMVSAMASGGTPGGGVHRKVHSSGRPGSLRSGLMETVVGSGPPVGSSIVRTGTPPMRDRRGTDAVTGQAGRDGSQVSVRLIARC
jgi:hypothetical protein